MARDDTPQPRIPRPPHPHHRRQPLPWQAPKPQAEDARAPGCLARILNSPSYRQANQDVDFLNGDDARGVRLQIDYLKAQRILEAHGIRQTVVVFGSTRIPEPHAAQQRLDRLRTLAADEPDDDRYRTELAVAERIADKSRYYDVARAFGRCVSEASLAHQAGLVIMTGGGPGIMEGANRGAFDATGKTVGLNISLPHEQFPNPYITPELCFQFHYFAMRKLHFLLRARALVAFPGGYGTLDELFETLTLVQTRKIRPLPIVLVGESFWRGAVNLDFLVSEGVIDEEDRDLFWYAESADDIWKGILSWHEANGDPLFSTDDAQPSS